MHAAASRTHSPGKESTNSSPQQEALSKRKTMSCSNVIFAEAHKTRKFQLAERRRASEYILCTGGRPKRRCTNLGERRQQLPGRQGSKQSGRRGYMNGWGAAVSGKEDDVEGDE